MALRQTEPAELPMVREFLARVFGSADSHSLRRDLMAWKYYEPRPDWDGSRSYVLESEGKVISHGCVQPMTFETGGREVRACQIIDWAADPSFPGAGLLLRRKIEELVEVCMGVGGSDDSRRVMPRAGYQERCQFRTFARVVRPIQQFAARAGTPLIRRVAVAARNFKWSLLPLAAADEGWTARPLEHAGDTGWGGGSRYERTQRTRSLVDYYMRCPGAAMSLHGLLQAGAAAGYFLLSQVGGRTRIADIQVIAGGWNAALALAAEASAELPETIETVASVTLPEAAAALIANGFVPRGEQPVWVRGRAGVLPDGPMHITSVDYDDFFAFDPAFPFVT